MTTPRNRYPDELPPGITADGGEAIRTAAGTAAAGRAYVTNRSPEARILAVSFLGVDADWLPDATRSRVLMPGETVPMDFTLHPAVGTLSAKYPFAITVQAIDPASGQAMSSAAIADYSLVVDAPGRVEVQVIPNELTRRLRGTVSIKVTNVGNTPENVRIEIIAPENVAFSPATDQVEVPPGGSATVPARIAIEPQAFGRPTRYSYTVTARGRGAARRADAAVTTRAVFGNTGPKFFAIVAIIALWAGLAITLIPTVVNKINQSNDSVQDRVASAQDKALDKLRKTQTATPEPGAGGSGAGGSGGSGSGGSGSGGSGGSGSGGSGSGGSGSGGSGSGANPSATGAQPVQFSGTVEGDSPAGVVVSVRPTSLVDEQAQGATGVGVDTSSFDQLGKIPQAALTNTAPAAGSTTQVPRSTTTKSDGAWGFAKVTSPGYYLVTFAKPGFQTQRFVLDAASAAATEPMKITMQPGKGALRGKITGPDGAVGGATVTLSDGTNTVTSSSNSRGDTGAWSVEGLSTPGTYLVTASKDGLSTESTIVELGAGDANSTDLTLKRNSTTLIGQVFGPTSASSSTGLGGVTVTATSNDTTRTTTTISTSGLRGSYRLPDLPAGDYVITTLAEGYLTQTQAVTVTVGVKNENLRTDLISATSIVTGGVKGVQFDPKTGAPITDGAGNPKIGPVPGAGIMLNSENNKYKVTADDAGTFRIDGVAPGNYVLSAEFAGLGTAYAEFEVKAGIPVKVPLGTLQLPAADQKDASSITGFVSSATDPSGALTCPADSTPADCKVLFTLRNSSGQITQTNTEDKAPYVDSSSVDPISTGPTPYSLYAQSGLPAGIYRLTVSAVGYLPTTITVRVPANTVANAPTAALFPTNGLVGTVTSQGNLSTDGPAGGPFRTCVWARPIAGGTAAPPTSCPEDPKSIDTKVCQTTGRAQDAVAVIDETSQQYKLQGLCDGQYAIYVFTTNPWYVNSKTPVSQTLFRGQTGTYSPEVMRDGRVLLRIRVLDDNGNQVVPDSLTGIAKCSPVGTSPDTSAGDLSTANGNGVVVVDGVDASTATASVTCTVTADGGYSTKRVTGLTVNNQQDTSAQVVLTRPVGEVVGRLYTAYDANDDKAVGNVTVTLRGTIDSGASTDTVTLGQVVTDGDGCFAVSPAASGPVNSAGGCNGNTVAASSVLHNIELVSSRVTVTLAAGNGLDGLNSTYSLTRIGLQIPVRATPVDTSGLRVSADPAGTNVAGATVAVTAINAKGAGSVSTGTVDSLGRFTWTDSKITSPNLASPGTYKLAASLPGFVTATANVTCPLQTSGASGCTLDSPLTLTALGGVQGTVVGILASGTSTTYSNGTRSYATEAPTGLTVTARLCTGNQASPNCNGTAKSATITGNRTYNFAANGSTRSLAPGTYQLTFAAPGYTQQDTAVTVTGAADATVNSNLFLKPIDFTVQLQRNTTPAQNYNCAGKTCQITVTRNDTSEVVQSPAASSGTYTFTGLAPGSYKVEAVGTNFNLTTAQVTIPRNDNPPTTKSTFTYNMPLAVVVSTVSGQITAVQGSAATATGLNGVTVELGHFDGEGAFTPDNGEDVTTPLRAVTQSIAGVPGRFLVDGVPDGKSYVARVNSINRVNGYRAQVPGTVVSVSRGVDNPFGTVELTRVQRNVKVTIAGTAGSGYEASTVKLQSTANGADLTAGAPTASGDSFVWTILNAPFGSDWKLGVVLPAGHLGKISVNGSEAPQTCTAGTPSNASPSPARTCTLTNAITVSGADTTDDVNAFYALNEYRITTGVTSTPLPTDPGATPPATVGVTITDSGNSTVAYKHTALSSNSAGSITLWGRIAANYSAVTTDSSPRWEAATVTYKPDDPSKDIVLTELGATVTITVKDLPTGATGAVVLNLPGTATSLPASQPVTADGDVVFTKVPYYDNVTATFSGTKPGATTNAPPVPVTRSSPQIDIDSATESATIDFP